MINITIYLDELKFIHNALLEFSPENNEEANMRYKIATMLKSKIDKITEP